MQPFKLQSLNQEELKTLSPQFLYHVTTDFYRSGQVYEISYPYYFGDGFFKMCTMLSVYLCKITDFAA